MSALLNIPVGSIRAGKEMLRDVKKESEGYKEILQSVRSKGILQPITVRPLEVDPATGLQLYGLIDGNHRWNCAQDLALAEIPAHILDIPEDEVLENQIVANVQNIDTRPVEYTEALVAMLRKRPSMTMNELAKIIGKSYEWLQERFNLIKHLKADYLPKVNEGKIPLVSAYALAKIPQEHQDNFAVQAETQPSQEFVPIAQAFVKNWKEQVRQGKKGQAPVYVPTAHFQKMPEIKAAIDGDNTADLLLAHGNVTTTKEAFLLALKWTIKMDPLSIEAGKEKFEQRLKEAELQKEKRKAEREAKKAETEKAQLSNLVA